MRFLKYLMGIFRIGRGIEIKSSGDKGTIILACTKCGEQSAYRASWFPHMIDQLTRE